MDMEYFTLYKNYMSLCEQLQEIIIKDVIFKLVQIFLVAFSSEKIAF
jgi:hypothetical protein